MLRQQMLLYQRPHVGEPRQLHDLRDGEPPGGRCDQSARGALVFQRGQLQSSSAGPKAAQGGIHLMVLPALPVPLLDATPAPLDPKPLLFGPVVCCRTSRSFPRRR
jgi:hypothetical protein